MYVVIGIVAHIQRQGKKGKYCHHSYSHVCLVIGTQQSKRFVIAAEKRQAHWHTYARTQPPAKFFRHFFGIVYVCDYHTMCVYRCEYGVYRVLNMDSVRLIFGRRIIYACVSVYADGVLDAVVLVFFPFHKTRSISTVCCRTSSSVMEFQRCVRSSFAIVLLQKYFRLTYFK